MKDGELSICKIKECNLEFMSVILDACSDYLKEHYPGFEGYIRNDPTGCYELYAVKEKDLQPEPGASPEEKNG